MPHKDPAVRREYVREWKIRNAEQHAWLNKLADAASHANARAEKYGAEGRLVAGDIRMCFASGVCFYCGDEPEMMTVDHVIPLHAKGPNTPDNIVLACRPCNISKMRSDSPGRWSQAHDQCVICGGSSRRHAAFGKCILCYGRERAAS